MRRAGIVVFAICFAATSAWAQESSIEQNAANEAFRRGDDAFDRSDFQAALDAYRSSLALVPSPNSRLLVARSLARLGRWSEALGEFETTVNEAAQRAERDPRFAKTHEVAETEAAEAREHVGFVRIDSKLLPRDARVSIDAHVLNAASWDLNIPHDPGTATIAIEARSYATTTFTLAIAAKATVIVPRTALALDKTESAAAYQRPSHPWIAVGVTTLVLGGASLVASAILAGATQSEYDAKNNQCVLLGCTSADVSNGRALSSATYVTLGAGLAVAAAGVLMLALGSRTPHRVATLGRWAF